MPKPVYALVGSDSFLQLQMLSRILSELPKDVQRVELDGERAELAEALDELRSFAMFGGAKLVVIRDADEFVSRFRQQLEDYLAHPSGSSTLVLRLSSLPKNQRLYKLIARIGTIEECVPPRDVTRWVIERGRSAHRLTVGPDAAAMLVELVGAELGRLDNELTKLALQCKGGRVGADDVAASVSFQREQEMWDMTNELATGRPAEALRRWRQLIQLDPSAEFRAVTWLTMWLEEVGMILRGDAGAAKLGWKHKDRLPLVIKTAKALGPERHARALDLLAHIDHQTKSGIGDAASNVERFILSLVI